MTLPVPAFGALGPSFSTGLFDQQFSALAVCTQIPCSASGQNAVTLTPNANTPLIVAYTDLAPAFIWTQAQTTTGAVTIGLAGLAALNGYKLNGTAPLAANDLVAGNTYIGTTLNALNSGAGGFVVNTFALTNITNVLAADVPLNNTANYFDGPSCAQGTTGTWLAMGTVVCNDSAASNTTFDAKLWDGTTVIASAQGVSIATANAPVSLSLVGVLASPAGNIRISVKDPTAATGQIKFNLSGNSRDSTLTVIRIL